MTASRDVPDLARRSRDCSELASSAARRRCRRPHPSPRRRPPSACAAAPAAPAASAPPAAPAPLSEDEVFARKSLEELNAEKPLGDVFFDLDQSD